jgi:hypothetical protein
MWLYEIDGRYVVPQLVDVCIMLHTVLTLTSPVGDDVLPRQSTLCFR